MYSHISRISKHRWKSIIIDGNRYSHNDVSHCNFFATCEELYCNHSWQIYINNYKVNMTSMFTNRDSNIGYCLSRYWLHVHMAVCFFPIALVLIFPPLLPPKMCLIFPAANSWLFNRLFNRLTSKCGWDEVEQNGIYMYICFYILFWEFEWFCDVICTLITHGPRPIKACIIYQL